MLQEHWHLNVKDSSESCNCFIIRTIETIKYHFHNFLKKKHYSAKNALLSMILRSTLYGCMSRFLYCLNSVVDGSFGWDTSHSTRQGTVVGSHNRYWRLSHNHERGVVVAANSDGDKLYWDCCATRQTSHFEREREIDVPLGNSCFGSPPQVLSSFLAMV